MSLFEAGMIVCFGVSWPVAILKTLKTRSVQGKSRMFLFLILGGYGLGILHKVSYSLDLVVLLYVFNFSMVFVEICLWYRFRDRPGSAAAAVLDEAHSSVDTLLAEPALAGSPGPGAVEALEPRLRIPRKLAG